MKAEAWDRCTDPVAMLRSLRAPRWQRKLRLFACACCRHAWDLRPAYDQLLVALVEQWADGRLTLEEVRQRLNAHDPQVSGVSWDRSGTWLHLQEGLRGEHPEQVDDEDLRELEAERLWFPEILLLPDACRSARMTGQGMRRLKEWGISLEPFKSRRKPVKSDDLEAWNAGWDEVAAAWVAAREDAGETEAAWQVAVLHDLFDLRFGSVFVDPVWLAWNSGTVRQLAEAIYQSRTFETLPVLADALEDAGCSSVELLAHLRGAGPHVPGCWAVDVLLGKS
jgi:hypothetical protein